MKKLFLVDAYALIYRCYYAFLSRPMRNADGMNTSAIFGFVKYMKEIIHRENPHYLGVAFDSKGPTFRHEMYCEYKANRQAAPEDIHASVPYIKEIMNAMRIPCLEMCGWEADDIIGTLSERAAAEGFEVFMVTPDKDFGQLVGPNIHIYKQRKNGEGVEIVGEQQIKEYYGIDDPRKVIDILALWGDASDNIPGVPGIGEKTAIKLVQEFGTVEQILARTDELKGKQKETIRASQEVLMLSKRLAAIDMNAPIEFDPDALLMDGTDTQALREIYHRLGFTMFLRELGSAPAEKAAPAPANRGKIVPCDGQGDLFATPPRDLFAIPQAGMVAQSQGVALPAPQGDLFAAPQGALFGAPQGDLFAAPGPEPAASPEKGYDCAATVEHAYHTIHTPGELAALVEKLRAHGEFSLATQTTGPDAISDRLVGISFAMKPCEAWYLPVDNEEYLGILKPLFADAGVAKVGQNLKFDMEMLAARGIETRGFKYDTMIMHYLIDPVSRHGMDLLAHKYLNYSPIEREAPDKAAEYYAENADVTLKLKEILWPQVIAQGMENLYRTIEEPMIDVLVEMETAGVRIDTAILSESEAAITQQLARLEQEIRAAAGDPALNVNSAKQLGDALFGKMKIDPSPKMTKTKQYRTDEEYLQSLSAGNPVIELILEYRGLKKLLTTYIDALPKLVNPKTGRVHASFNQAVTSTGRLSSSNPNLQNIPIRDSQGRELRRAFVPANTDHLLLSADYSQVELRLMADLSGDQALLDAFRNKEDVHTATASLIFSVLPAEVTHEQRRRAKTANFGIIYGISAFGLGQRLNIPRGEAREIIDGYFRSYPGVADYMQRAIEQARADGYVTTIFGRKLYLPDIRSGNATVRGLAERNAINAPIQGSAADIIKIAMIAIWREFRERGLRSKVILQVHDELVVDMYKPEQQAVVEIVVRAMEGAAQLKIDLTVDYGIGTNWLEAH